MSGDENEILRRCVFLKRQAIFLLQAEVEQRLELISRLETEIRELTEKNQIFEGPA